MTGLADSLIALIVAGVLNLLIAARIKARMASEDRGFLLRIFWCTLGIRYALALVLNRFADSALAGMFWGDSSTYDAGGYAIALNWQGDLIGTPYFTESVGRYGFYYFVG